jgi:hypothetical protein
MSNRSTWTALMLVFLLVGGVSSVARAADATNPADGSLAFLDGNCQTANATKASPAPGQQVELPLSPPAVSWMSANPCRVTCSNGSTIDCTWSWAGDPTYCCFKNSIICQSYNCNTGSIVLSKHC